MQKINAMIYILIPIYNRKELTLACLASFAKQTYTNYELIIVDDGSTDGSQEAIKKIHPEATIIQGDGDWWWAKSVNEGVHFILGKVRTGDYVLIINNDVEFDPDYLEKLISASVAENRALVGSLVKNFYDKNIIQDAGVRAQWHSFFFPKSDFDPSQKINRNIDALATRGILVPVEVFQKIGLFSRMLPHHAADYDFSMRAKRRGFTLVMSYEAIVYSKDRPGDKQFPFWQNYFSRRSSSNIPMQISFALIDAPTLTLKFRCVALILGRFARALFVYLFRK